MPPVLSVVDYDAWEKGYMPPTEHVLIDQLAYRGARVVLGSDIGVAGAYWLVVRDMKMHGRPLLAVMRAVEDAIDILSDDLSRKAVAADFGLPPLSDKVMELRRA